MATIKELIRKLENREGWYAHSLYLPEDFIKNTYLDFLRIIDINIAKKVGEEIRATNKLISLVIRKLIKAYTEKEKNRILNKNETSKVDDIKKDCNTI